MKKFVLWSVLHKHLNVALTEDMSKYAQGDTFWQAMQNLSETLKEWTPSITTEESEINARLRMYQMTGINKVEIFVEKDGKRFAVRCANTCSFIKAGSEREALMKYVEAKAKTSKINPGCGI